MEGHVIWTAAFAAVTHRSLRSANLNVSTGNDDHNLWCSIRLFAPTSG